MHAQENARNADEIEVCTLARSKVPLWAGGRTVTMKVRRGWAPGMERQAANEEGRQVKCLIASEGHLWMKGFFDRLPAPVRLRLANGPHNICPACVEEEAERIAFKRHLKRPTTTIYFEVIAVIEKKLDEPGQ